MRIGYCFLANSVVALLLWGSGSVAQADAQSPSPATSVDSGIPNPTTSTNKHKGQKEKRWSGSLVDANCMAKAMSGAAGKQGPTQPNAGGPRSQLFGSAPQNPPPQMGPGQPRQGGALPSGQSQEQNPDMSQAQAAEMARVAMVDKEAKQCAATAATTTFGLVISGGQVVKFDDEGNTKVGDALKAVTIEPGKQVKAKVTGTLEDGDTMKVASVEIKGKRSSSASATQGGR